MVRRGRQPCEVFNQTRLIFGDSLCHFELRVDQVEKRGELGEDLASATTSFFGLGLVSLALCARGKNVDGFLVRARVHLRLQFDGSAHQRVHVVELRLRRHRACSLQVLFLINFFREHQSIY